jgi:cell division protein FtsI (penicillin-binding protein 3)
VRAPDLRASNQRLAVTRALLVLVFLGLAARAAHLAVLDQRGADRGERQSHSELRLPPERGTIVDRRGAELAVSVTAPSIYAIPSEVRDVPATARTLGKLLGADPRRLSNRLEDGGGFVYLARWVPGEMADRVRALGLPGTGILLEPHRAYPYRELAAHVLGFANLDGAGVRGAEQMEDGWLRGTPQSFPVERDAHGRLLSQVALDHEKSAGGDVALTLDAALQADAEIALDEAMAQSGAKAGFVISLDPHTGEVLALAERPTFDPNAFRGLAYPNTRARSFLDAFEPGSTFKIFLVAAALEANAIAPSDVFDCEMGSFQVPGGTIRDAHPHGLLDVAGVVRVSSNIGAAKIAYRLDPSVYYDTLREFGFGTSTRSGFPNESAGLLRSWKNWRPVDRATLAFGQGVDVTPIQLAAATAAIANGGVWVEPHLVARRRAPEGAWEDEPVGPSRRVIRPETAARVLAMMEGVVSAEGTGKLAAIPGVRVGGKTGTAQKIDPATGRYGTNRYFAWFTGVAPIDDPKVVIVTALDEPRGIAHTGGAVAAPLFSKVAAAQLARMGIPTVASTVALSKAGATRPPEAPRTAEPPPAASLEESLVVAEESTVAFAQEGDRVLLPDFQGLTVDQVRKAAADARVVVEVEGVGRAVSQEPGPGTILSGGERRVRVRFGPGA